jgi:hypothetical protein
MSETRDALEKERAVARGEGQGGTLAHVQPPRAAKDQSSDVLRLGIEQMQGKRPGAWCPGSAYNTEHLQLHISRW